MKRAMNSKEKWRESGFTRAAVRMKLKCVMWGTFFTAEPCRRAMRAAKEGVPWLSLNIRNINGSGKCDSSE
jgi:hypothetical protein